MRDLTEFEKLVLKIDETYILAIQNIGAALFFIGIAITLWFVHYIFWLYLSGIATIVFGILVIGICEKILDIRKALSSNRPK